MSEPSDKHTASKMDAPDGRRKLNFLDPAGAASLGGLPGEAIAGTLSGEGYFGLELWLHFVAMVRFSGLEIQSICPS